VRCRARPRGRERDGARGRRDDRGRRAQRRAHAPGRDSRPLFGGSPDETLEATRRSSPITYADQINAPIFVIQGENDTRCPARQMKVYEEKLKSLGKSITVYWFDAGHGSRAQEQQIEQQEMMLRFAYQVLG